MKLKVHVPLLVIGLSVGMAASGCLYNVKNEARATITIENIQLDGPMRIKDDGWIEVKRLKARADTAAFLAGIRFSRIDLVIRKAMEELTYPSVPQWMVFRGALVEDGFPREVADFMDNEFYFRGKVILYAGVSKILSLSVRLLPSGQPVLIGFILSGYELPRDANVIYNAPSIGNEIIVIHSASNKENQL